jgi:hypothetical protein
MAQVLLFLGLNFTLHRHLSVVLLFQVAVCYTDIMACIERNLAVKDVPASWADPFRRCFRIMISVLNFLSSEILQDVYLTTEDFFYLRGIIQSFIRALLKARACILNI